MAKKKTDEKIRKQVKKELNAMLEEIGLTEEKDEKNQAVVASPEFQEKVDALEFIRREAEWLKRISAEEFAEWLIEQHDSYVEEINWKVSQNWLDGETSLDKQMIVTYIYHIFMFLEFREVTRIEPPVAQILKDRGYTDLLHILSVLGYI